MYALLFYPLRRSFHSLVIRTHNLNVRGFSLTYLDYGSCEVKMDCPLSLCTLRKIKCYNHYKQPINKFEPYQQHVTCSSDPFYTYAFFYVSPLLTAKPLLCVSCIMSIGIFVGKRIWGGGG